MNTSQSNTLVAGALGALGGAGLATCMTLAPRTTVGIACITCALAGGASMHHNQLVEYYAQAK